MASLSVLSILTQRYLGLSKLFNNTKFASYSGETLLFKSPIYQKRKLVAYVYTKKVVSGFQFCPRTWFASSVVFVLLEQSRPCYELKVG